MLRPRTRAAIGRTLEAGIHVVLVTGRMFQSVRRYALEAGIESPVVCYQGAVVADPVGGSWLRHVPIPLELARETIAALKDEGFSPNCYVDDELYVAEVTPEARRYADFQHLELHEVGNLLEWLDRPPTKLVVIDDPDVLDDLKQRMLERFAGRLYISKSLPYLPRVRLARGDEGCRARLPRQSTSGSVVSGRSRSATARTTSSSSTGRATAWPSRTPTTA